MSAIQPFAGRDVTAYNVREFGAKGDGATNDAAACQAAIAAALAAGGQVRFPPGRYLLGSTLEVEGEGVDLVFDDATLVVATNIPVLHLGDVSAASATYHRIGIDGFLTIEGSNNATHTLNHGLMLTNVSYCDIRRVKVTKCRGVGVYLSANARGTQYNRFGSIELTANLGGNYFVVESLSAGGYVNDNHFDTIRLHDNEEGGATHMRLISGSASDGVNENHFSRLSVESLDATDSLLSLEGASGSLTQANVFDGLRLDGTTGTDTLTIDQYSPANLFFGITFDGDTPSDASGTAILWGNRGSSNFPYMRMGNAALGGANGWEIAVQQPSSAKELHIMASSAGLVRFPGSTGVAFGDADSGADVAAWVPASLRFDLRTLPSTAIGSGPQLRFNGEFASTGDAGSVIIKQIAALATGEGLLGLTGALQISKGIEGGLVVNEYGQSVDFRVESNVNTHAFFLRGTTGKIGLGVSSPAELLDIGNGNLLLSSTAASTYGVLWQRNGLSIGRIDTTSSYLTFKSESGGNGVLFQTSGGEEVARFVNASGNVVFNEGGADHDFRVEGLADPNLFSLDAGNDRINLGSTAFQKGVTQAAQTVTSSASITVDWTAGNVQTLTLGHSPTIAFTNPIAPAHLTLILKQDGTGSRVFTLPTLGWGDSIEPRWSTAANAVDILFLFFDGTNYHASAMVNSVQV